MRHKFRASLIVVLQFAVPSRDVRPSRPCTQSLRHALRFSAEAFRRVLATRSPYHYITLDADRPQPGRKVLDRAIHGQQDHSLRGL